MISERMLETLKKSGTMKQNMLAKGLTRAKAKCPYCSGYWQAALCGYKKHMHMACDGDCGSALME